MLFLHDIKPIETIYNGYKFRSRLEARWAVFFDAMGIEYEYEKEGYDLGKAGWYLPDFWLPEFLLWVEIKPPGFIENTTSSEHIKARALRDGTGYPVMICYGLPKQLWSYLYITDSTDNSGGTSEFNAVFIVDNSTREPLILVMDNWSCRDFLTVNMDEDLPRFINKTAFAKRQGVHPNNVNLSEAYGERLTAAGPTGDSLSWKAALAAKQARFEHK